MIDRPMRGRHIAGTLAGFEMTGVGTTFDNGSVGGCGRGSAFLASSALASFLLLVVAFQTQFQFEGGPRVDAEMLLLLQFSFHQIHVVFRVQQNREDGTGVQ